MANTADLNALALKLSSDYVTAYARRGPSVARHELQAALLSALTAAPGEDTPAWLIDAIAKHVEAECPFTDEGLTPGEITEVVKTAIDHYLLLRAPSPPVPPMEEVRKIAQRLNDMAGWGAFSVLNCTQDVKDVCAFLLTPRTEASAGTEEVLRGFLVFVQGMSESGSWDKPTLKRVSEVLNGLIRDTSTAREARTEEATEDMAAIGESLLRAIENYKGHPAIKNWHPCNCPSEIVGDLLCKIDEATEPLPLPSVLPPELIEAESLVNGNESDTWTTTMRGYMGRLPMQTMKDLCKLTRALLRTHGDGWTKAIDTPKEWEGKLAWEYFAWSGEIKQNVIATNFSRKPKHCTGVYWQLIPVPSPPTSTPRTEASAPEGEGK